MRRYLRTILALAILAATVAAFVYYVNGHPETLDQLRQLPLSTIVLLLVLYGFSFLTYVSITRAYLHVYGKAMSARENILFNIYSSLINFFGPGQSGPVFRAAYLKKRHNLGIKQFTFATFLYLGFFAVISAMLMFMGSCPWWQTVLLMSVVGAASLMLIRMYKKRSRIEVGSGFNLINIGWVFGATALQVAILTVIYGIELQRVGAGASIGEILAYTGVSNFSLFVALTPGAIGIREAFLVFSQNLHHIDSSSVVAANIVDRAAYLLFLGVLFILTISLHAKEKLQIGQLKSKDSP